MTINNVRIFLNEREGSDLKATATMLVNNQILLQSIRIFEDPSENPDEPPVLRVSYPIQRLANGNLRHCLYPSNTNTREKFDKALLDAYQKVVSGEAPDKTVVFDADETAVEYEVTRASIYPSNRDGSYRAKVGIELDGELWLRGMNMVVRENGAMLLTMPRRQMPETEREFVSFYHPINQDARNTLTAAVMPYYDAAIREKR